MSSGPANEPVPVGPPLSVVTVALLQLIGALPILFFCGITLWGALRDTGELRSNPIAAFAFGAPFCLAILAVIASVGLLRLKEWARRASLWLVSLSTLSCVLLLIFCQPQNDPLGIIRPIAEILLAALLLVTVYYWLLFTEASIRSAFRQTE